MGRVVRMTFERMLRKMAYPVYPERARARPLSRPISREASRLSLWWPRRWCGAFQRSILIHLWPSPPKFQLIYADGYGGRRRRAIQLPPDERGQPSSEFGGLPSSHDWGFRKATWVGWVPRSHPKYWVQACLLGLRARPGSPLFPPLFFPQKKDGGIRSINAVHAGRPHQIRGRALWSGGFDRRSCPEPAATSPRFTSTE